MRHVWFHPVFLHVVLEDLLEFPARFARPVRLGLAPFHLIGGDGDKSVFRAPRKMRQRGPFLGQGKQRMTAERRVGPDQQRFSVVFARSVAVRTHVFRHRLAHVGPRAAARPSSCTARRML